MYTSAFAAGLVVGRLKSRVRTMSDLVSLPVGIYAVGRRWVCVGGEVWDKVWAGGGVAEEPQDDDSARVNALAGTAMRRRWGSLWESVGLQLGRCRPFFGVCLSPCPC